MDLKAFLKKRFGKDLFGLKEDDIIKERLRIEKRVENLSDDIKGVQEKIQKLMVEWGESHGNVGPEFETALKLEELCEEALGPKGVYPNVDYYSGILYTEMGIAPDQFTPIFAVSRIAGWLAQWREQLSDNRIFRPTQIYTGEGARSYVPMSER